jgi:anthranilate phosphoribosyltransferase
VKIELAPEKIEECLHRVGFAFLYAPLLHEATKYAQPVRKELGIRTIFNLLGPLTNPTAAPYQILGVYAAELTPIFAEVLNNLGSKHALVVHGDDGLDEITTTGISQISELKEGIVKTYKINPSTFSIPRAKPEDLKGGDAKTNAQIALAILKGEKGPKRDIVVLNAACAVYTADRGLSIKEAVGLVEQAIDSGKALEKLEILKEFTNKA